MDIDSLLSNYEDLLRTSEEYLHSLEVGWRDPHKREDNERAFEQFFTNLRRNGFDGVSFD